MRLSIGYSDSEDRIWIRVEKSTALWWMTRRLALRLIEQWATLMERSYPDADAAAAADAEAQRARAAERARALRREHGSAVAVARGTKVEPVGRPAPGVELATCVLASIDLSVRADLVTLVLKAPGRTEPLKMSRQEAHRMLDALLARCRRSGWYDATLPHWLAGDAAEPAAES